MESYQDFEHDVTLGVDGIPMKEHPHDITKIVVPKMYVYFHDETGTFESKDKLLSSAEHDQDLEANLDKDSPLDAEPIYDTGNEIRHISLANGQLFINDEIVEFQHNDSTHIHWIRTHPGPVQEYGIMKLTSLGMLGSGVVKVGDTKKTFTSVGPQSVYEVYYSDPDDHSGERKRWHDFVMGMTLEDGSYHNYGDLQFEQEAEPNFTGSPEDFDSIKRVQCIFDSKVEYLDPEKKLKKVSLHAELSLDFKYNTFYNGFWHSIDITFSDDYSSFSGTLYAYDDSAEENKGKGYHVEGVFSSSDHLTTLIEKAGNQAPYTKRVSVPVKVASEGKSVSLVSWKCFWFYRDSLLFLGFAKFELVHLTLT